ncbi:uncharacterized protein BX663DRAFT_555522 [Cokeromyces recurvatus]|uniref:uncharacterized protein n=1 Tax=Cokeromyces recurvatus TaxID=90255 RepID=UPI00221FEDD4|nr:uncharacterized protein BX663DRAFT_555522 [Cokeromyces recurvatus]KAI7898801.1 hypothetical protein BX663DRAFT_555522 [Cokeromyces recurvatus]
MTHLSDFSFLLWTLDKFSCLHPKRFQQGELKNITSVKIKYEEGFANVLGRIFTKPEVMWTEADRKLVIPTEYSLCIGFSLQTGTLVLLQCFWNYLANSVAKASFMSSKEFMFYICWTFSSFIIFPLLQYNFSREIYEPTYKEIIPEMVYGIELFIVACLGVVSHFRFKKLLSSSRDTVNGRSITQKIRYFQDVNKVLSTVLFGHGILLTILSCDGLTTRKTLNAHKFSADFFICNINMCAVITWLCMILIFHPKHTSGHDTINENDRNPFADGGKQQVQNVSGISSTNTYAHHASTFILGVSRESSEYTYKDITYTQHPLSKSWIAPEEDSVRNDSAFQFGPLPIPPSDEFIYGSKMNSTISAAPSMSTLVSSQQLMTHHGSQGKNSRRSTKASIFNNDTDYFKANYQILDDKKTSATIFHQPRCEELEMNDLDMKRKLQLHSSSKKGFHHLEQVDTTYVPPPLSPARKSRDIHHHGVVASDRRRYMHFMNVEACEEDMDEFGINKRKQSTKDDITVIHFQEEPNEFKHFKQQQHQSYIPSFNPNPNNLQIDIEATKKYPLAHSSLLIKSATTFDKTRHSIKNDKANSSNSSDSNSSSSSSSSSNNNYHTPPPPPTTSFFNIPTASFHPPN